MEAHRDSPLPHPESTTNDDKVKARNRQLLVSLLSLDRQQGSVIKSGPLLL